MNLGKARPLSVFFWLVSLAVAAYVLLGLDAPILFACCLISVMLGALLLTLSFPWKRARYLLRYLAFLCLAVALGIGGCYLHSVRHISAAQAYATATQDMRTMEGVILSKEVESSYIQCYGVCVDLPESHGIQAKQAKLYLSVTGESDLNIGDRLVMNVTVYPVDLAPEEEWRIRTLRSDGYTLCAYADAYDDYTVTEKNIFVWREPFSSLQSKLSYRLSDRVGGEQGKLVGALLLGTKKQLSDMTTLEFRRAGTSHLLALSGLHLSLLVLFVDMILRSVKCPYFLRVPLLLLFALAFLFVTGCSISTQRATFMLICLYLSRLRGSPHDAVTPLSVFFGCVLLAQPYAIYDVGLWMTTLATLAVVEVIPTLLRKANEKQPQTRPLRLVRMLHKYVLVPVVSTVVVVFFLMIPMALVFGEFSIVAPLANLLLSPITTVVLAVGLCTLPLAFLPLGMFMLGEVTDFLCRLLHWLSDLMLRLTQWLSDIPHAVISLRYDFVAPLLMLLGILLVVFLLFRWKKPYRVFAWMLAWCLVFAAGMSVTLANNKGQWQVVYTTQGKSELLCLDNLQDTILCDFSDGGYTTYRALLSDALPVGTTEIEAVVLTHYHNRHISSMYKLFGDIRVRHIWLPLTMPQAMQEKATQDESILHAIVTLAESRRVQVHYYVPEEGTDITETLTLESLHYDFIKRSTHPTVSASWNYRHVPSGAGNRLVWLGSSSWESDDASDALQYVANSDAVIFASHGPVVKKEYVIDEWSNAPSLVFYANESVTDALTLTPSTKQALADAHVVTHQGKHAAFMLP